MILYFGALFTKHYALKNGGTITPTEYAVTVEKVEIETGKKPVQNIHDRTVKKG